MEVHTIGLYGSVQRHTSHCHCRSSGQSYYAMLKSLLNWFAKAFVFCQLCVKHVNVIGILVNLSVLLLLYGDVETNPGPTQQVCPTCSVLVDVSMVVCDCGYRFRTNPPSKCKVSH